MTWYDFFSGYYMIFSQYNIIFSHYYYIMRKYFLLCSGSNTLPYKAMASEEEEEKCAMIESELRSKSCWKPVKRAVHPGMLSQADRSGAFYKE